MNLARSITGRKLPTASLYVPLGAAILLSLFMLSERNFILLHSIVTLFGIAVSWCLPLLVGSARQFIRNDALAFLAIGYACIGAIGLVHTLAYSGMGGLPGYGPNLAAQLWIAGRGLEALTLLLFPLVLGRNCRIWLIAIGYGCTTALLLATIFAWGIFPNSVVEGQGLTRFYAGAERAIGLALAGAIVLLARKRGQLDGSVRWLLVAAIAAVIAGEFAFTLYLERSGFAVLLGYLLKVASSFLIYLALIRSWFTKPYATMFRDLEQERRALQESEARLLLALSSAQIAMSHQDRALRYTWTHDLPPSLIPRAPSADPDATPGFTDAEASLAAAKLRVLESGDAARRQVSIGAGAQRVDYDVFLHPLPDATGGVAGVTALYLDISRARQTEDRLARLNQILLHLGNDLDANIQALTEFCGQVLDATCALYNRLDMGMLCTTAQWHGPADAELHTEPDGHLCYDVIRSGSPEHLVVHSLPHSRYAESDPNVLRYGLETYIGHPVLCDGNPVGSLCAVFQTHREFTVEELRLLSITAAAIAAQEERGKMRAELATGESKLHAFLETASEGVWITDEHHVTTYVNQTMADMLGEERAELLGKRIQEVLIPGDGGLPPGSRPLVSTERNLVYERRLKTKCGSTVWAQVSATALRDDRGHYLGAITMCADITDRKRIEDALRASEERLHLAHRATNDIVWDWDVVRDELRWGVAGEAHFGWTPFADAPQPLAWREARLHPDDRRRVTQSLHGAVRDERCGHWQEEFRFRRPDGSYADVLDRGYLIRDAHGRAVRMVGAMRDFSERKRAEGERRHLEAQLAHAHKMESVGRLAGGVAHDYNNMLHVILGHTELVLDELGPEHPASADLQQIRTAAERSARLTEQLLAFARKQIIAPQPLDLNGTVEHTLTMLRRVISEEIRLDWRPEPGLWPVVMDPTQIDQIVTNLCMNASDALTRGGEIVVETANVAFDRVFCDTHPGHVPGEYVLLAVSDNGSGMDHETLEHLFEPFFTTKEVGKGTGLGLATVDGIVSQNGGFVVVYSTPGRGSTFHIYLPRCVSVAKTAPAAASGADASGASASGASASGTSASGAAASGAAASSASASAARATILLVEDDLALLETTRTVLQRHDYTVLASPSPREALRMAREHPGEIHLVVTDVVMPEMNGRELVEHLKPLHPNLRTLYMSGYAADAITDSGVLDEGVQLIQKPFSMRDLETRVGNLLPTAN